MAADALDVISLTDAKVAVNISTADHDAELELFITAISRRFDELLGPVVNRSVTEYHDGGRVFITPRQTPLSSVTTLKEYDGATTTLTAETFGTEPSDAYLVVSTHYAHSTKIYRRNGRGDTTFPYGRQNVELVYVAGRAATTAAVDKRISQTAGAVLRRLWKREAGAWSQSATFFEATDAAPSSGFFKAVDPVVKEMLADELKLPGIA